MVVIAWEGKTIPQSLFDEKVQSSIDKLAQAIGSLTQDHILLALARIDKAKEDLEWIRKCDIMEEVT